MDNLEKTIEDCVRQGSAAVDSIIGKEIKKLEGGGKENPGQALRKKRLTEIAGTVSFIKNEIDCLRDMPGIMKRLAGAREKELESFLGRLSAAAAEDVAALTPRSFSLVFECDDLEAMLRRESDTQGHINRIRTAVRERAPEYMIPLLTEGFTVSNGITVRLKG